MAEQNSDKTEAPTPKRRQQARENGQIARSNDLTNAVMTVAGLLLIGMTGQRILGSLMTVLSSTFNPEFLADQDHARLLQMVFHFASTLFSAMWPLLVGLIVVAFIVNIYQVGFQFRTKRLKPNLGALNPFKGIGRLLGGGGRSWVQLLFNIIKLSLITTVAYSAVHNRLAQIVTIADYPLEQIFALSGQIVYDISLRVAVALLIIAILDFAWQKWRTEKDLKMSKQEIKDEMKNMDGDPTIKRRRRQIQMQRALQRIHTSVPTADVVVTNPTHFAVALKYDDDGSMRAPKVVAKGADYLALKIRQIARENGVPVIERPPLARALYKAVEVGQEIPESFYSAVAEILAYVWEITGKIRRKRPATSH